MKTETEKNTTLTRVRIAVLGKVNVGKSGNFSAKKTYVGSCIILAEI